MKKLHQVKEHSGCSSLIVFHLVVFECGKETGRGGMGGLGG